MRDRWDCAALSPRLWPCHEEAAAQEQCPLHRRHLRTELFVCLLARPSIPRIFLRDAVESGVRPSKLAALILFMWLHSQLWHCQWRKGRGKGCFFSEIQTQRYYPSTDFNLISQILTYNQIQATDRVPPSLSLLSAFLTLLSSRVCISLPHIHLRQGTFHAAYTWTKITQPQNPAGSLHQLKAQR